MSKCPVCGNTKGFAFGTCIRCHYNKQEGFKIIEVPMDILIQYMPLELVNDLLVTHYKKYVEEV